MSRRPDYRLKVLSKRTDKKAEVGAGWLNKDGSISLRLNLCSVLTSDPDLVITLFPVDEEPSQPEENNAQE